MVSTISDTVRIASTVVPPCWPHEMGIRTGCNACYEEYAHWAMLPNSMDDDRELDSLHNASDNACLGGSSIKHRKKPFLFWCKKVY